MRKLRLRESSKNIKARIPFQTIVITMSTY